MNENREGEFRPIDAEGLLQLAVENCVGFQVVARAGSRRLILDEDDVFTGNKDEKPGDDHTPVVSGDSSR